MLVIGVGNPLMSDDGVGQRLLEALSGCQPELDGVEYVDAGTLGFLLLPRIERAAALLVLDAAQFDAAPGEVRVLDGPALDRFLAAPRCSVHELGLRDLLDAARLTDSLPSQRALVGVQAEVVRIGEALSPAVAAAVPAAVAAARTVLEGWLVPAPR